MTVNRYFTESYFTNCYLIQSGNNKKAMIVDPVGDSDELKEAAHDLDVLYIVNTHGHFDHITGNSYFKENKGARIAVGKKDSAMLTDPELNLSTLFTVPVISPAPDILFENEGKIFRLEDDVFSVMFFPGHTAGGIALYQKENKMLFSGDFIFLDSIGRMDSPTGSIEEMKQSLERVISLPEETAVFPGHGLPFKLGDFIREVYPNILKEL